MKPRTANPLVAVVGGSGAGKTWLADHLQTAVGNGAGRLSLDDFYRDRSHLSPSQRQKINYDHPRAIDWPLFEKSLKACRAGRSIPVPRKADAVTCAMTATPEAIWVTMGKTQC